MKFIWTLTVLLLLTVAGAFAYEAHHNSNSETRALEIQTMFIGL